MRNVRQVRARRGFASRAREKHYHGCGFGVVLMRYGAIGAVGWGVWVEGAGRVGATEREPKGLPAAAWSGSLHSTAFDVAAQASNL